MDDFQLRFQIRLAVGEFFGRGFVVGRDAARGGGEVQVAQSQAVVARDRDGLVREPGAEEGGIEKIARGVAGELASRAVGAVRAGGESHYKDARSRIAESGDGLAPVFFVDIRLALDPRHFLAPSDEAGTLAAGDDFGVEYIERFHLIIDLCCIQKRADYNLSK